MGLFLCFLGELVIFLTFIHAVKWNYKHYDEWPERRLLVMRIAAVGVVLTFLGCIVLGCLFFKAYWYDIREYIWFT